LLYHDAHQIEECRSNLSMGYELTFHEDIHKSVECYIDNIVVKSCDKDDHLVDLK